MVALGGCAAPPVQSMSDARQMISAAESAGATAVPDSPLGAARASLKKAETLIAAGDYREARREAESARKNAADALAAARGGESAPR
jgi:Domain of unknown function (DUF4398)